MESDRSNLERPTNPATAWDWKAILTAGVTASLVFQLLEIILIPISGGGSPWGPARMIAAIVLGTGVLPPPDTFDLFIVSVALAIDIVLAVIYAAALSWMIRSWKTPPALLWAAVFGAILYVVNFYGFTRLFPWFEMGRNGVTILTHIVFSLSVALVFKRMQPRQKTV